MTPDEARNKIVKRLEEDLVGPIATQEVLEGSRIRPSDVYLTGILWPIGDQMGGEDDDGSGGDDEDDESPSSATVVGQQRPCAMGVSFATAATGAGHHVTLTVRFATYSHSPGEDKDGNSINRWTRQPYESPPIEINLSALEGFPMRLQKVGFEPDVELHVRSLPSGTGRINTITLINRSRLGEAGRVEIEQLTLFQTEILIRTADGSRFVPRPPMPAANDEDEKSGRLLYRNCHEFAAGHQCSVDWDAESDSATLIRSTWLPKAVVPAFREDGDPVFAPLVQSGFLDARSLAGAADAELSHMLKALPEAYATWIARRDAEISALPPALRETAKAHLSTCRSVCGRIEAGIKALQTDRLLRDSFRYANAAMALQHSWKPEAAGRPLRWRPFQLGFILLAAESACIPGSGHREIFDLLWFPTGGGKTEAYLAIVAMVAWYRRLSGRTPEEGGGNASVMRYTLRLLTAQQFERASAMILACELVRRGSVFPRADGAEIATAEFSIGLWVGRDATPNDFKQALETRGQRGGSSAEQIERCPCCQSNVRWDYDEVARSVQPFCGEVSCLVGGKFGKWPIFTVDSDIYRKRPTLVIGTVDKFAQLPFKVEIAELFGFRTSRSTDLIIQDELHLISGPLGTITGLYETAFDSLLRKSGIRPKVIGSTATIRQAKQQIRALFDRESCQFPPSGLGYENSGFAVVDPEKPGRLYLGVSTAGRSAKFVLQGTAGSLLQSGGPALGVPDGVRDGYATLLCYFNSLRELGGAIVQMLDDVPDSVALYTARRGETGRVIGLPRELTSRVSQREITEILGELKRGASDPDCVGVVLATNMVSVGVDVPRLGLMIVNGQPKTRSEYIQSTSRVGRSAYPGLVVSVLNAGKARDRSHFETFPSWHGKIYRDVEATSVTPFASRARDRALHAIVVSMIRHGDQVMAGSPDLNQASNVLLGDMVETIEERVKHIDARELGETKHELDERLADWEAMDPQYYLNRGKPKKSLLQYAETYAKRIAAGRLPGNAWPTMNTMRSVEPSTRFRLTDSLSPGGAGAAGNIPPAGTAGTAQPGDETNQPRWRRKNA